MYRFLLEPITIHIFARLQTRAIAAFMPRKVRTAQGSLPVNSRVLNFYLKTESATENNRRLRAGKGENVW